MKYKRLPPILHILAMPLIPLVLIYFVVMWLLGYWTCDRCNKTFWITEEKHIYSRTNVFDGHATIEEHCSECKMLRSIAREALSE